MASDADNTHPLRGVVLCCTSIPFDVRFEIAEQSERMGAQHTLDLTSDVTHLIVGHHDTPKYKFVARERADIKLVTPEFIRAVRELWIQDAEIDLPALEAKYARPVFLGLRICVTGFDDFELREQIARGIQEKGGIYTGDLTKANTHLIAARTAGAKYTHASAWGLKVVSVEWFQQSIERGMILDEGLFHPSIPQKDRGAGAWKRLEEMSPNLGKRQRNDSTTSLGEGKRKLRRTASTKLSSDSQNLWGDILSGGSFQKQEKRDTQWDEDSTEQKQSVAKLQEDVKQAQAPQPPSATKRGMFANYVFSSFGFASRKTTILRGFLEPEGGLYADTLDDLVAAAASDSGLRPYFILPHELPRTQYPDIPTHVTLVTEWWIEMCVHNRTALDPKQHVFGRPFRRFPIDGFEELTICSTGFPAQELRHATKAISLLGAKYSEDFTPKASLLICNSPRTASAVNKMRHARSWNIPVVSSKWLFDSIDSGLKMEYQRYLYSARAPTKTDNVSILKAQQTALEEETASKKPKEAARTTKTLQPFVDGEDKEKDASTYMLRPSADNAMPPTMNSLEEAAESAPAPLQEISPNSPKKVIIPSPKDTEVSLTIPTQPVQHARSGRSDPVLAPEVSTTITSLLRSRSHSTNLPNADSHEGRRKRNPGRILGRAVSNASAGSARASSVESTTERPVDANATLSSELSSIATPIISGQTPGADGPRGQVESPPPPATQKLEYDNTEGVEYRAHVMAKMMGEDIGAGSMAAGVGTDGIGTDGRKRVKERERVKSVVGDLGGRQLRRRSGFR